MTSTSIAALVRGTVAAAAIAVLSTGPVTQTASAAGLRNCVDVPAGQANRVGCYENVWAGGAEYRMTFSNVSFSGSTPKPLDAFYVIAPQGPVAQGPVATFPHDHVVRDTPRANGGSYSTKLQGFFVLCSAQGLTSGACVPFWTAPGGSPLPFAQTVNGHRLTSADSIEAASGAGDLVLVNLGQSAVIVGSITEGTTR